MNYNPDVPRGAIFHMGMYYKRGDTDSTKAFYLLNGEWRLSPRPYAEIHKQYLNQEAQLRREQRREKLELQKLSGAAAPKLGRRRKEVPVTRL